MANKQVTVELPTEVVNALEDYARGHNISPADALVKAIATLTYIETQTDKGAKVFLDKNGEFRQMRSK